MTITGHSSRERCCWSPTTWLRSSRSTTRGSQPTSPTASIRQWSSVASTRRRGGYIIHINYHLITRSGQPPPSDYHGSFLKLGISVCWNRVSPGPSRQPPGCAIASCTTTKNLRPGAGRDFRSRARGDCAARRLARWSGRNPVEQYVNERSARQKKKKTITHSSCWRSTSSASRTACRTTPSSAPAAAVTGSPSSWWYAIGLCIASALAADGFLTSPSAACGGGRSVVAVLAELRASEGSPLLPGGHWEREDRVRLVSEVRERFSRPHVLVNNAGVVPQACVDLLEAGEDSFERPPRSISRARTSSPRASRPGGARSRSSLPDWLDPGPRAAHVDLGSVDRGLDQPRRVLRQQRPGSPWPRSCGPSGSPGTASPSTRCGPTTRTDMTAGVAQQQPRPHRRGARPPGPAHARGRSPVSGGARPRRRALFDGAVIVVDGGLTLPRL